MKTRELLAIMAKPDVAGTYMMTIAGAFRILPEGHDEPLCPIRFTYWKQLGLTPPDVGICAEELGLSRLDTLKLMLAADTRLNAERLGPDVDVSNIRRMLLILCGRSDEIPPDPPRPFICQRPIGTPNSITDNITDAIVAADL